jgi:hypothetical protein
VNIRLFFSQLRVLLNHFLDVKIERSTAGFYFVCTAGMRFR